MSPEYIGSDSVPRPLLTYIHPAMRSFILSLHFTLVLSLSSSINTLHRINPAATTMAALSTVLALLASTALAGPSNELVWSSAS